MDVYAHALDDVKLAAQERWVERWKMPQWSSKWSGKMSEVGMLLIGA
jgi:hypothetical protein